MPGAQTHADFRDLRIHKASKHKAQAKWTDALNPLFLHFTLLCFWVGYQTGISCLYLRSSAVIWDPFGEIIEDFSFQ